MDAEHPDHPHGSLVEQVHRVMTTDQGTDAWTVAEAIVDVVTKRAREPLATEPAGQHVGDSHDPGRPFAELLESGLLWLINTSVFHPRGLALAVAIDQETGEASGWSLLASEAGTAYRYAAPCEADDPSSAVDVDELFRLASATMEQARLTTWGG